MSCGDTRRAVDPCETPDLLVRRPTNRPGLASLSYRIGRHPDFLARMRREIARQTVKDPATQLNTRPLAALSARDTSDPTIALMDAWAGALDVLTFYQERIANEGYLGTAAERLSALELARMIGYELNPGVAASTHLAFTVEDADDPFRELEVPSGTQVMSVPQDTSKAPQTFETVESIDARAEWNEIPARTERPQYLALRNEKAGEEPDKWVLYLLDLDNSFNLDELDPGDIVTIKKGGTPAPEEFLPVTSELDIDAALDNLEEDQEFNPEIKAEIRGVAVEHMHLRGTGHALKTGMRTLVVGRRADVVQAVPFRIVDVEEDTKYSVTRVDLAGITALPQPVQRKKIRFRPPRLRIGRVATSTVQFRQSSVEQVVRRASWTGSALTAFVRTQAWSRVKLMRMLRQPPEIKRPPVGVARRGFYVLRQRVGAFGNTAPRWEMLAKPDDSRGGTADNPYPNNWDGDDSTATKKRPSVWKNAKNADLATADLFLEREVEEAVPDGWILLENPAGQTKPARIASSFTVSRSDYAISGKATGLKIREPRQADTVTKPEHFRFRNTTINVASESLALSGIPIRENVAAGSDEVMLDNLFLDLVPGRPISLSGSRSDAPGVDEAETLILRDVSHTGGYTRLSFQTGPEFSYELPTVRVNANVALATHGEAVVEPLGDGDATKANQAFALAKPPLTFVSAANERGSATTLVVRVNGVQWKEVPSLYEAGPDDEVYQVRIDDDGTTRVVFGDGERGARLPTGAQLVTCGYRSGMGVEGEVGEETLVQLKTRPLGVSGVSNPSAASGAASAESLDDARVRAPQSVRTLGRIVSISDYEDFARAFAGVGKAMANSLWLERDQIVHVTVAPATDSEFTDDAPTLSNLREAIARLRDPSRPVVVSPHRRVLFELAARVVFDPRFVAADVDAAMRAHLESTFGYAARSLGQQVTAAEVLAAMHDVDGIDHVDLTKLQIFKEDAESIDEVAEVLPALPARPDTPPNVLATELLTVLSAGITLTLEAADA